MCEGLFLWLHDLKLSISSRTGLVLENPLRTQGKSPYFRMLFRVVNHIRNKTEKHGTQLIIWPGDQSVMFFLWEVDTAPKHVQLKWSLCLHTLHNWSFGQYKPDSFDTVFSMMPPLPEVAEKMSPSWTHCWQGVSVVVWSPEGTLDPWDKRKRGVGRPETLVFLRHPIFETLWDIIISARLLNTTDGGCNRVFGGFFFFYHFLLIGVTNEKKEIWGYKQPETKK